MLTEPGADSQEEGSHALIAALVELEQHVGEAGWDRPPRLFALVHTDALVAAEPALASELGLHTTSAGAPDQHLTAIEQENFLERATQAVQDAGADGTPHDADDLVDLLASIAWPETVHGCALAAERTFLPADAEADLSDGARSVEDVAEVVARHPLRQDIRIVVGVDRAGRHHGVARLRSQPDELLGGPDLVPGLVKVLAHTLV